MIDIKYITNYYDLESDSYSLSSLHVIRLKGSMTVYYETINSNVTMDHNTSFWRQSLLYRLNYSLKYYRVFNSHK
jgi:hypothetical protein